ncbi:MAG: hypothetical protein OEZ03_16960, partial [Alphaproteobacteria bacterium]|nr:hypothetical protein [Alphaproteobacteria bacterium]
MRFIAWRLPGLLGLVFFGATLLPYTVPLVRAHEQHMAPDHSQTMPGAPAKYSRQFADYTIPPVALVDMSGADVTLSDALQSDPPVLLDFI